MSSKMSEKSREEVLRVMRERYARRGREARIKLLDEFCELCGYKVMTAADGDEALVAFGKHHQEIDLILTDLMMRVMNGVDLARVLKMAYPTAKIIVSSGKIDRIHEAALGSIGVHERLWKPYRADQLLAVIHKKIHEKIPRSGDFSAVPE
jgi:CheY-like chemotaxis protein